MLKSSLVLVCLTTSIGCGLFNGKNPKKSTEETNNTAEPQKVGENPEEKSSELMTTPFAGADFKWNLPQIQETKPVEPWTRSQAIDLNIGDRILKVAVYGKQSLSSCEPKRTIESIIDLNSSQKVVGNYRIQNISIKSETSKGPFDGTVIVRKEFLKSDDQSWVYRLEAVALTDDINLEQTECYSYEISMGSKDFVSFKLLNTSKEVTEVLNEMRETWKSEFGIVLDF